MHILKVFKYRFWLWDFNYSVQLPRTLSPTVLTLIDILNPPFLWLTPRKPLWLDLQPADIKSRWRHNWKSAQVVNSHLVCDPTIRRPGFDLPGQQWSVLNHFRTGPGQCGTCRRKWRLTVLQTLICVLAGRLRRCPTLSNPVLWQSWMAAYLGCSLLIKVVSWLTNYGWWHPYEKQKN